MNRNAIFKLIERQGILPLFYHDDAGVSLEIIQSLYQAGVRVVEYTNRGSKAVENFSIIVNQVRLEMPEMIVGIGTIKNEKQAKEFIDLGAHFIVSPVIAKEVAGLCSKKGLLHIPGCFTPSEIQQAQEQDALLIKIFPAQFLGPTYIASLREIFPGQAFIPTGGVDLDKENIREWFKAGVIAVGIGSKLIGKNIPDGKSYGQLHDEAAALIKTVKEVKGEK
jgi:2-dehydro-3-deoxyphosphogluconate aldolase / (4S)-4-hydroxy-2-oxoglutarate aldolase